MISAQSSTECIIDAEHQYPLPRAFYQRYMWFWHVVTGLLFVGLLSAAVSSRWGQFDRSTALAVVLTLVLMAIYTRFYVFAKQWPQALWKNLLYFGCGILAILLLTPSYPYYVLLTWMMFGQAFRSPLPRASEHPNPRQAPAIHAYRLSPRLRGRDMIHNSWNRMGGDCAG